MVYKLKMMPAAINRLESGKHNPNMETVMRYILAANGEIKLSGNSFSLKLSSYEEVLNFVIMVRKQKGLSQLKLAEIFNISKTNITNIENQKVKLTCDYFLKIINLADLSISIEKTFAVPKATLLKDSEISIA